MSAQAFERLKRQFDEEYSRPLHETFGLLAYPIDDDSYLTDYCLSEAFKKVAVGLLPLPTVERGAFDPYWVFARDYDRTFIESFLKLSSDAGSELPPEFCDEIARIENESPAGITNDIALWVVFVWCQMPPDIEAKTTDNGVRNMMRGEFFHQSSLAIRRCRLDTDHPQWLKVKQKRGKAGRKKKSAEERMSDQLVYEYYQAFAESRLGSRSTYHDFAEYADNKYNDMPTVDPDEIKNIVARHRRHLKRSKSVDK